MSDQTAAHARSAQEIQEMIEMERSAGPFVWWTTALGEQRIVGLAHRARATLGRASSCDLVLADDPEVSRIHAELEQVGDEWAVVDDGLSRNGTFVNGARILGRKRLGDGDAIKIGATTVAYRHPGEPIDAVTSAAPYPQLAESISDTQRRILVALCRPYKGGNDFSTPASNNSIAAEVSLSTDAVKTHLRSLFARFEISDLPQNQKRTRLVECAFQLGLVSAREL